MKKASEQSYFQRTIYRLQRQLEVFIPARVDRRWLRRWIDTARVRDTRLINRAIIRPARELLGNAGKRWRPLFGVLMLDIMEVHPPPYELLLAAVTEVSHTGALIIDDIQDSACRRRGRVCAHQRYGLADAINAANALYFLPLAVISRHKRLSEEQKSEIYEIMTRHFLRAHLGQAADLQWAGRIHHEACRNVRRAEILQAYADKTGAVVEGVCEIAAVIAGCSPARRRHAAAFGRAFGIAYQITDDILDMTGAPGKRRPAGEDIQGGKLTLLLFLALRLSSAGQRARLMRILNSPQLRRDPHHRQQTGEIICDSGAVRAARTQVRRIYSSAWRTFCRHFPDSPARHRLDRLCRRLLRPAL